MTRKELEERYGGYWGDGHPVYDVATWKMEVQNGDTRAGYWDWLEKKLEAES